jgi:hypothetical protein
VRLPLRFAGRNVETTTSLASPFALSVLREQERRDRRRLRHAHSAGVGVATRHRSHLGQASTLMMLARLSLPTGFSTQAETSKLVAPTTQLRLPADERVPQRSAMCSFSGRGLRMGHIPEKKRCRSGGDGPSFSYRRALPLCREGVGRERSNGRFMQRLRLGLLDCETRNLPPFIYRGDEKAKDDEMAVKDEGRGSFVGYGCCRCGGGRSRRP